MWTPRSITGPPPLRGFSVKVARGGSIRRGWSSGPVRVLGILLVAGAALFGWQQWRAVQQVHELQDLDLQILSSDLPIDAYLDRGFLNWLKDDSDR